MFTNGTQPLRFAPWQPIRVYFWQAYIPPDAPAVHCVAALCTTLDRDERHAFHPAVLQPFNQYGGVHRFEAVPGLVPSSDIVNSKSKVVF